jgi:G2/mitotic-specific cyclin 1/2
VRQDETLEYYAGYSEEEIQPVVLVMIDYMARPVIHEAFFKKYASKRFLKGTLLLALFPTLCRVSIMSVL